MELVRQEEVMENPLGLMQLPGSVVRLTASWWTGEMSMWRRVRVDERLVTGRKGRCREGTSGNKGIFNVLEIPEAGRQLEP